MPPILDPDVPAINKAYAKSHTQRHNLAGFRAPPISTVRVGIIGMTRGANHVKALVQLEGVEIGAICDKSPAVLEKAMVWFKDTDHKPAIYTEDEDAWKKLCEQKNLDLIFVCSPIPLHAPMSIYAMQQGKHVCSEVAAAWTMEECWERVKTAEETQKHFMMLQYDPYTPTPHNQIHGIFGTHGAAQFDPDPHRFSKGDHRWYRQGSEEYERLYARYTPELLRKLREDSKGHGHGGSDLRMDWHIIDCLRADELTFPQVLRGAGYRTFYAGKWHLGEAGVDPENFGFEINRGGWRAGAPDRYFAPWTNPKLPSGPDGESLCMRLGRETSAFIEAHRSEPFLAFLSFYSVHSPLQTTKPLWEKYRRKALARGAADTRFAFDRNLAVRQVQDCPVYAGMIETMDAAVGLVLDTLDRLGLAENTIVCFTSDNGGVSSGDGFASSMLPLRGGKGRQWEGGIREPLFVRYPAQVAAGTTCAVPVSGIDFYPTLLELAGLDVPREQAVDGRSFVRLLQGASDPAIAGRDLFWHYPHYGNQGGDPSSMIRRGNWKLIHYHEDGHDELYDLATDLGERHDVHAAQAELAATLRRDLDAWLKATGAKFPVPDPAFDSAQRTAYLRREREVGMPRLEVQHARFLDADWQPNDDWWGSLVVND